MRPMRRCATPRRRARGFTLIELLVVMTLIVVLASVALVAATRTASCGRAKRC